VRAAGGAARAERLVLSAVRGKQSIRLRKGNTVPAWCGEAFSEHVEELAQGIAILSLWWAEACFPLVGMTLGSVWIMASSYPPRALQEDTHTCIQARRSQAENQVVKGRSATTYNEERGTVNCSPQATTTPLSSMARLQARTGKSKASER
jgi:hypothetical protein